MSTEVPELPSPRQEPQMFSGTNPSTKKKEPAAEVGYFLWRERETRGLTIESASEATGIHPYHIDAIEQGDLTHMPPRLEAMEMIAGYAQFLGFEPQPLVDHLATFLPAPPIVRASFHPARPPILSSAKVLAFGKMPRIPSLNILKFPGGTGGAIASMAAAFFLIAGTHWMMSSTSQSTPAVEQVAAAQPKAPAIAINTADQMPTASTSASAADVKITDEAMPQGGKLANAIPADDPDALGSFIQDQADPAAAQPKAVKPDKAASTKTGKIQDRIRAEDQLKIAAANPIPQPSDGRVYGAENKDARLVLKATAPVWLRIEDAQGVAVMTQMLNTGDIYRVPNREGLIALSRDGGRLAFMIDGQQKGVLGPPGKILVSEKLDLAALQAKK